MKLPVKRVERYTRAGSAELGATPKVTEAVFAPDVLAGRELRTVEIAPGKVVALGVKAHEPATAKPLEEVRGEVLESARLEAAGRLAAARAGEVLAELGKGAALAGGSDEVEGRSRDAGPETGGPQGSRGARGSAGGRFPRAGAERNAALRDCDTREWRHGNLDRGIGGAGQVCRDDAGRKAQRAHDEARDRAAMSDATVYVTSMRANAEIDVNPQLFE